MHRAPWLLHPFLVGVYFVLTLAADNASALQGWREIAWPAAIVLAIGGVSWALGFVLTRDAQKTAILVLLWVVAFSAFGYVAETLRPAGVLRRTYGELGLLGLFGLAVFGPSLAVCRTARDLGPLNRYFTLVGGILAGYAAFQLSRGLDRDIQPLANLPAPVVVNASALRRDLPDIYLIVLDKYTASEVLAQHFRFDNSEFETFLKSRGFIVPRHSRANYPRTQLALASMLNLEYVHNLSREQHLNDLIENNRLAIFLKDQGYRFVFFPTPFKFTSHNRNADLQIPLPSEVRGEFRAVWERTTMLPEMARGVCALTGCEVTGFRLVAETAELMDRKFERLAALSGGERPTFALAHLVLPHEPFLYRADCTPREPYYPWSAGVLGDEEADRAYLDQISCANRKLASLVDSIHARSRRPPVILFQADHGHGRLGRHPDLQYVDAYRLRERMAAFSAYLLPGLSPDSVSDSISPVNVVRLVLRHYFGAELPALEDASYWSSEDQPLDLVRITW